MMNRRKNKYIQPALQNHLVRSFLLAGASSLILQYAVFVSLASRVAREMPNDGAVFVDRVSNFLLLALGGTLLLALPATYLMGMVVTHKVAGPVQSISTFLREVIEGKQPDDCHLRGDDQLQELCGLVNEATAPLRDVTSTPETAPPEQARRGEAA